MKEKQAINFSDAVRGNTYPGRGIIVGCSSDGAKAVVAYFIMGRSVNSRNRVFVWENDELSTAPFDETKVEDPSLIIYTAVRREGGCIIVSNGDQTDTICDGLRKGMNFYESLETRTFEPDAPNYTPRISACVNLGGSALQGNVPDVGTGIFRYSISILKSKDADGSECERCGWDYQAEQGIGQFIHTYAHDGNPLPSFEGDPVCIEVPDDIDAFAAKIWEALDKDNKISLFVGYTDIKTGETEYRLINKNSLK